MYLNQRAQANSLNGTLNAAQGTISNNMIQPQYAQPTLKAANVSMLGINFDDDSDELEMLLCNFNVGR